MHLFHITLTYLLLIYLLFQFIVPIKYSNCILIYASRLKCYQRPAHQVGNTVRLLEQATPLPLDQICGHQTAPTPLWSTAKYEASSSTEFVI